MNQKRVLLNLISNILSFIIQLGINFILTPIIVLKVGEDAYGFIGLANNFVSYATIITVVINSMASRFITVEYAKNNKENASKYYSSVFFMNTFLSFFISVCICIFITHIDQILEIPKNLIVDTKITFILAFINLILSLYNTVFNMASFVCNRIDLSAIRTIIGNVLKAIILIVCFNFFVPKIYFICFSSVIMTIYLIITNYKLSKKLCPDLIINKKFFDGGYIKKLAKSGIWNSINSLSKVLLTGLDLLIANRFVGPTEMGILSIAKTISIAIESLLSTFSNTFNPQFVWLYSKGEKKELIGAINDSLKVTAVVILVPIAAFIAFGMKFFKLWLPGKTDPELLKIQILSILSILPFAISASNYNLFLLDSVTNKLRRPVIATLIMSILSTITTIILLKTTKLGVYAIVGVSSLYWVIKTFFFNTINAAINLQIKWYTFFKPFIKNLGCFCILLLIFYVVDLNIKVSNWISFAILMLIVGILGYIISFIVLLNKKDKEKILRKFKRREEIKQENG